MEPFERAHQVLHDVPRITESGGTLFHGSAMDMARRSLAGQRQHGLGDQETKSSIRMSCMGRIQQHGAGDGCKQLEQCIHGHWVVNLFNAAFHQSGCCRSRKDVIHAFDKSWRLESFDRFLSSISLMATVSVSKALTQKNPPHFLWKGDAMMQKKAAVTSAAFFVR